MGNRALHCVPRAQQEGAPPRGSKARRSVEGSIVPEQDPLLRTVARRVVLAEIGRDFELTTRVLGTGYSGAVRLARHRATGQEVAVKTFKKRRLKPHRLKLLKSEVEVYLRLDHPNVCRLLHAYEGRKEVWLVMELCGCELHHRLCERKAYREQDAADVMLQMLQAVNYLHSHCIVHRDLKLENWMYSEKRGDDRLKLIDFGFSQALSRADDTLDMPCGTLLYTSPEVLARKYTRQCDMWSLGVIGYMLLVGRPPFRGGTSSKIAKAILQGEFAQDRGWEALSATARDFLRRLLQKDEALRMDATQALAHPWVTGAAGTPREIGLSVLASLRQFANGSRLRRAALTVLAYGLTSRDLADFEDTFLAFDKTGRGTIGLDQLRDVLQRSLRVSPEEVRRIFESFELGSDQELHYTPFIAALIATRLELHEDKVRTAFKIFDREGTGFITAESLTGVFTGGDCDDGEGSSASSPSGSVRGLTSTEAERWISEVDYRGNGLVGYDEFLAALLGRSLWALPDAGAANVDPGVRVYDGAEADGRTRCLSESFAGTLSTREPSLESMDGDCESRRSRSFTLRPSLLMTVRHTSCDVDDRYFG